MKKVIFSLESIEDLENIWFYIAQDSPTRADSFIDKLRDICKEYFFIFPKMGSPRNYLNEGLLAFPFKNYMIYYRCYNKQIEIVRILHGSLDMERIFQDK